MTENPYQQWSKRQKNREIASIVADICGVSPAYVRMVINGEYDNEKVLTAYMTYLEGKKKIIKEVEALVPFIKPR